MFIRIVFPAKAGIQKIFENNMDPVFRRNDKLMFIEFSHNLLKSGTKDCSVMCYAFFEVRNISQPI